MFKRIIPGLRYIFTGAWSKKHVYYKLEKRVNVLDYNLSLALYLFRKENKSDNVSEVLENSLNDLRKTFPQLINREISDQYFIDLYTLPKDIIISDYSAKHSSTSI